MKLRFSFFRIPAKSMALMFMNEVEGTGTNPHLNSIVRN